MLHFPLPRLDKDAKLTNLLLPFCRIKEGEIWLDKKSGHKVGCLDAASSKDINRLFGRRKAELALHDPPYNMVAFGKKNVEGFIEWCKLWVELSKKHLKENSSLYVWLGAEQKNHFQPLPEFLIMMRDSGFDSKSFITMRNQRGYGTSKNWMSIRQELLFYTLGKPLFNVNAVYTDIPKVLKGYYKEIKGIKKENIERSKSDKIRAGNVWMDIQQVFHLRHENVNGCFAQKPLKAYERIIEASTIENDLVFDFFCHAGTTLIAAENLSRRCFTIDINPIYCEIAIRRLENLRKNGLEGWQASNPFAEEILQSSEIQDYLSSKYDYNFNEIKTKFKLRK